MRIKDAVYVYKFVGGGASSWHGRYHIHEPGEYEVHLFLEGEGAFLLNRSRYLIEKNRLFLTRPREFHAILPDAVKRPISYYAILFEPDSETADDQTLVSLIQRGNPRNRVVAPIESRERFLIEELYRLSRDTDQARQKPAEYLLLSLLHRWFTDSRETDKSPGRHEPNEHVESSLRLMQQSLRQKLSVGDMAGNLGLSEEYFIRLFHKELGMSPFQYFTRLKIEAASSFLVDSNRTVGSVADYFGFENPFHFSRIFKKCTGLAPQEYRRTFSHHHKDDSH
ncbi:AraC family transcriptional regulator [Breznakiella homolactica]|uniref:AraC family transcriptional regulator n=1 Tax=Breznakiella homolactica TaxID=2798577 RepID=A0A7T7XR55_9SPIR|nr:AraC family transcriptional regulator [Breznakiella homolactica]QQO10977.1 AraC family transcriptional regulator [Breznakiella homolactica]